MSRAERSYGAGSQATDVAYQRLRAAILDGSYPPGARLGQVELAEALGVSRTPIRDALRRLSYEGLVELSAKRGAKVMGFSPEDLEEAYDLRETLEVYAARRAATRIDATRLEHMERLCDGMDACLAEESHDSYLRLVQTNDEFHHVVHSAAGSRRLLDLTFLAAHAPVNLKTFRTYRREELGHSMQHHRELVMALRARDPQWAATVSAAHVRAARYALFQAIARSDAEWPHHPAAD